MDRQISTPSRQQRWHVGGADAWENWRWVADINPITPIVETFRAGFLDVGAAFWARLGYTIAFMLVTLFIGVVIFNRVEKTFIDTV
jgi:lipopolysaccharide transport system permease protein